MTRTNFNSSTLVRLLSRLSIAVDDETDHSVAEKLGDWLSFTDAIALFSALNADPLAPAQDASGDPALATHAADLARTRTALEQAIRAGAATGTGTGSGRIRIKLPRPALGVPVEIAADYTPYLRYYFAHQRDMELEITRLRIHLRAALTQASPALRTLATLDATLEEALTERERSLLASLPLLLEKRFDALRTEHLRSLENRPDNPDQWLQTGSWLATFCADLQDMLIAELELRLLPATGLLEALQHDHTELQGSTLSP